MSSVRVAHALGVGLTAVALMVTATPTATDARGVQPFRAEPEILRSSIDSLDAWIDSVRRQHNIPAMAAIVFRADTVLAGGIAGVRRANSTAPVEGRDRFQLGSNTKAITTTLLATLVEEGKLSWSTRLADVFPRDSISPDFRAVTIDLLLSHNGGISPFDDTDHKDFRSIPRLSGNPAQRRAAFTAWVLRGQPAGPIGQAMYSNGGYTIAGAIAERIAGDSWESLVRELSLDEYAHFLQVNLRGLQGHDTPLLKAATIKHLHTSPVSPPDKYGLGWGLRDFDGAPASLHTGSAGAFYAVTIIQPTRDVGAAVFANAGGERAAAATADAVKALIRRFAKIEGR